MTAMEAAVRAPAPPPEAVPARRLDHDNIVVFDGFTWGDFQRLLSIRGDRPVPRLAYLEGQVEIMTPSRSHESIKSVLGCLLEAWCLERGVEFSPYGSWTLEDKEVERALEPDECYVFGEDEEPKRPDLAIEVVWTSGGIDKLEIYRKLDVREVWWWEAGRLTLYALRGEQYEEIPASEVLPDVDLPELLRFLDVKPTSRAIREYRRALQSGEG